MDAIPKRGVDLLDGMLTPAGWTADRWETFVDDAHAFRRDFGREAHRLGWTALELFGMSQSMPGLHLTWGAVPMIGGCVVLEVTAGSIACRRERVVPDTGQVLTGATMRIYRRPSWHDAIEAWLLPV